MNDMKSTGEECLPSDELIVENLDDGKYSLHAVAVRTQNGIDIYVGGGDLSHIGTVVISQPRLSLKGDGSISCTTSVFNLLSHKDDAIAVPLAEELCKKLNQVVVVTAGVHIDNADKQEIERFIRNLDCLGEALAERLLTADG